MGAYYNEIDPYAAQWLRNLITAGHIAAGDVDTRSIKDVSADDLRGYTQCHFFAGLGGWSHALRLAGWEDDRPVWTGSCPCQPFSAAGKGGGVTDDRHLWPAWFNLIRECRPPVIFGEQVDAAIRHGWLDLVSTDLEGEGYAIGAAGIPAAGVGSPHIRQRLWFVADCQRERFSGGDQSCGRGLRDAVKRHCKFSELADTEHAKRGAECQEDSDAHGGNGLGWRSYVGGLADTISERHLRQHALLQRQKSRWFPSDSLEVSGRGKFDKLADYKHTGLQGRLLGGAYEERQDIDRHAGCGSAVSFWSDADWLPCRDGKSRPVEPGTFPLAHGATARVGRLRAYGNAIVPQVAQAFIEAYRSVRQ